MLSRDRVTGFIKRARRGPSPSLGPIAILPPRTSRLMKPSSRSCSLSILSITIHLRLIFFCAENAGGKFEESLQKSRSWDSVPARTADCNNDFDLEYRSQETQRIRTTTAAI